MSSTTFKILDVPKNERFQFDQVLRESFAGIYLWHAKRTLGGIELVRGAYIEDEVVGLAMLRKIAPSAGYVYYIAVSPSYRRKGIGSALLDDAINYFSANQANSIYASVEEDNAESLSLFKSRGFRPLSRDEFARKHGRLQSKVMLAKMMVVYGEIILLKTLDVAS